MTHRDVPATSTLTAGVLVGALVLVQSIAGAGSDDSIPPRPQLEAVQVTVEALPREPLPRILVPDLELQAVPDPGLARSGTEVLPRPRLALLGAIHVPEYRDPLPTITVPELLRPRVLRSCERRVVVSA